MSDKQTIHVIVTAPFATNRGYLARTMATHLASHGLDVDVSRVPVVDIEPPCDVEKGPVVDEFATFHFSEHFTGYTFALSSAEPRTIAIKPAPQQTFHRQGHGIAVMGVANSGKSTIISLLSDQLRSTERGIKQAHSFKMIGEESPTPIEQAVRNVERIKDRIVVVFHVRRSKLNATLDEVLAECDRVTKVEE